MLFDDLERSEIQKGTYARQGREGAKLKTQLRVTGERGGPRPTLWAA